MANELEKKLSEYFMGIALLCEKRSKDPSRQVGACIVNTENQVIATGYNGAPLNYHDLLFPWGDKPGREMEEVGKGKAKNIGSDDNGSGKKNGQQSKYDFVCHAELNAIVNKDPKSVEGCTIYVTLFPCNECAKVIVRSGIEKVVYLSDERKEDKIFKVGKAILENNAKIDLKKFSDDILPADRNKVFKYVLNFLGDIKEEPSKNQTKVEKQESEKETICWNKYFMALAKLSAEIPSISDAKQGACIVNKDKRIVGLGYVQDIMPPTPEGKSKQDQENMASTSEESSDQQEAYDPNLTVCHAPVCAIVNKNPSSLRDCTMYVTHYPCKECAKVIVQSGIHKVIYLSEENKMKKDSLGTRNHQPKGCRFADLRHEEATEKSRGQIIDPTTEMFAVAHIKFKKYKISVNADAVKKRKLENELTVVLDYAEVIPNESSQ